MSKFQGRAPPFTTLPASLGSIMISPLVLNQEMYKWKVSSIGIKFFLSMLLKGSRKQRRGCYNSIRLQVFSYKAKEVG